LVQFFLQFSAAILHDRINSGCEDGRYLASKLDCVGDAKDGFRSQPIGHIRPVEARRQLPNAQILFRPDFVADVARLSSIRDRFRLTQDPDEGLRSSRGILNGSETPCVEITESMSLRFRSFL
jgi:hypothetical protein